jgi:hypothetical protein
MFELLLVDRPRKPVGPEDDISGDYSDSRFPAWVCVSRVQSRTQRGVTIVFNIQAPPRGLSGQSCKTRLGDTVSDVQQIDIVVEKADAWVE